MSVPPNIPPHRPGYGPPGGSGVSSRKPGRGLRIAAAWTGAIGVIFTVGGVVALVVAFFSISGLTPGGLIDDDGGPGPDAVGYTEVPGSFEADLAADQDYRFYLVYEAGRGAESRISRYQLEVTGPDGEMVRDRMPEISTQATRHGWSVNSARDITPQESGTHTVELREDVLDASQNVAVVLAPVGDSQGFGSLFTGVFAIIGGIGALIFGVVLLAVALALWLTQRFSRPAAPRV